ncbi:Ig-like domain-containing protein, partial [Roseofilum sp. BLCC_M154]
NDTDVDGDLDPSTVDLDPSTPGIQDTLTVPGEGTFSVDNAGNVTFDPDPTFVGTATIPYTVNDSAGNTSNEADISVTVTGTNNNPPDTQNKLSETIPNDEPAPVPTLTATDPDVGDTIDSFTITSIPDSSQGQLLLNGNPVTVNQQLTPEEAAQLVFDPNPSFTGDVTFKYTATDNNGNTDATPATVTIPVVAPTPTNPPEAQNKTGDTRPNDEPSPVPTLTATDPDNDVSFFTVTELPPTNQGTLLYNGEPVEVGQIFTPEQAAQLVFDPNPDFTGDATFKYTATDEAGNTDQTPATVTLPLVEPTTTNPPEAQDKNGPVRPNDEPSPVPTLTGTDPDNDVSFFTVTTIPPASQGTLFYNGVPVQEGQKFTPEQAGQLIFNPNPSFTGDVTFNYTVTDEAGNTDLTPATVTLPLVAPTPTNPPEAQDKNGPVRPNDEPSPVPTLTGTDPDGDVSFFTVTNIPPASQGTLFYNGEPVKPGDTFTPEQAGQLVFNPNPSFTGDVTFNYTVTDEAGNTDPTPATVTLPLVAPTPTNPPEALDRSGPVRPNNEPSPVPTLTGTDPDGDVSFFTVTTLPPPSQGTLFYNGVPVQEGQKFTPEQAGQLVFNPNPNFTGNATFNYTATDSVGNTDLTPATVTLPVAASVITAPPEAQDKTAPIRPNNEPSPVPTLTGTDPDGDVSFFTVSSIPTPQQGTLFYKGVPVQPGQTFTPDQAGELVFQPNPNFTGDVTFDYTVTDSVGNTDQSPAKVTLPVSGPSTTLPPEAIDRSGPIRPNNEPSPVPTLIGTDPDGDVSFFTVTSIPTPEQGTLFYNGVPVKPGQTFTPEQAGQLIFSPNPNFAGNVTFNYTVTDGVGNTDPTPATVTLPIQAATSSVPPVPQSVQEQPVPNNTPSPVTALSAFDPDGEVALIEISSTPTAAQGTLFYKGEPVKVGDRFTPDQARQLVFDPNPTFTGNVQFQFDAIDNGGNRSTNPGTVTIPVLGATPTAPPVANPATSEPIAQGTSEPASVPTLTGSDPDGIVSFFTIGTPPTPEQGTLFLNGEPVVAGQLLTPEQASQLTFVPNPNFTGDATFTFLTTDERGNVSAVPGVITLPVVGETAGVTPQPDGGVPPFIPIGSFVPSGAGQTITEVIETTSTLSFLGFDWGAILGIGAHLDCIDQPWEFYAPSEARVNYTIAEQDFFGTEQAELLRADHVNNRIYGYGGYDLIMAYQGDDTVFAGTGNDTAYGGRYHDILLGQEGFDILFGDQDNDTIFGGPDDDQLYGGQQNDWLLGGLGNDTAIGDRDNDWVFGEEGYDSLMGHFNQDIIFGGLNSDTIHGGQGWDILFGGQHPDTVFGDLGNDTVHGNLGNDCLMGGMHRDWIYGDQNRDVIHAGQGHDVVFGGQDEDTVFGDRHNDTISGDDGDDSLMGNTCYDVMFGDRGNDTMHGGQQTDLMFGGQNEDSMFGDRGRDVVSGDRGFDILFGNLGGDFMFGGTERDTIFAGQDDDWAYGGQDSDLVSGDRGNDIVSGDRGSDYLFGNQDNDTIYGCTEADWIHGGQQNDVLYGGKDNDTLNGDRNNDVLFGDLDNDSLLGNQNLDILSGGAGNDILFGGQDEDTLYGNQGDDTLSGDLGKDLLFGGEGIDLFVLRTGSAANDIPSADIVGDFQIGLDFIGLTGGLTFVDVTLEVLNNTTLIKITQTNQVLGIVNGVTPDQLIPALIPVDIGLV